MRLSGVADWVLLGAVAWLGVLLWRERGQSIVVPIMAPAQTLTDDEDDEDEDGAPVQYRCGSCQSNLDPALVWGMESGGSEHQWVFVTHHCPCLSPDAHRVGRYAPLPEACAYIVHHAGGEVRRPVTGGWRWENPSRLRYVSSEQADVKEFRETLERLSTVDDFLRLYG